MNIFTSAKAHFAVAVTDLENIVKKFEKAAEKAKQELIDAEQSLAKDIKRHEAAIKAARDAYEKTLEDKQEAIAVATDSANAKQVELNTIATQASAAASNVKALYTSAQ